MDFFYHWANWETQAHQKFKFCVLKLSKKFSPNTFNLLWTQRAACIVQFIHFSIAQIYVICNFPLFQTILLWTFLCNILVYIFESFFMIYLTRNCWALRCTSQLVSSVTQSCPTLCDSMDCSTPGFLVLTISRSLFKLTPESVMPSNHLTVCHPLLLLSISPRIKVFSNESVLRIRWPKY